MYQCKNCGGNIKFDIASQLLKCEYCGGTENPATFIPDKDADEHHIKDGEYDVTIFTCSQCGAEIISDDTTAATFCNFCGGTAVLQSRLSREKCPDKIIPFQLTKEDCKKIYKRKMRRGIFAPSGMKNADNIERFRGIYMPFWLYDFKKSGELRYEGTRVSQKADSLDTNRWDLSADVDIAYSDIAFDASSTFTDSLSRAITPFDMKAAKDFTPAYLSGFYADTNDVDSSTYRYEAIEPIVDEVVKQLDKSSDRVKFLSDKKSIRENIFESSPNGKLALFPVWFLAFRNKDRLCYAAVNGQTGRAAVDLPIDPKKYLLASLLVAILLFLAFLPFAEMEPFFILATAGFFSILCGSFTLKLKKELKVIETLTGDWGLITRAQIEKGEDPLLEEESAISWRKKRKTDAAINTAVILIMIIGCILIFIGGVILSILALLSGAIHGLIFTIFVPLTGIGGWIQTCNFIRASLKKHNDVKRHMIIKGSPEERILKLRLSFKDVGPVLLRTALGVIPAGLLIFFNPALAFPYYAVSFVIIILNIWSILEVLVRYNRLTTKELPQFKKERGEEK